MSAFIPRENHGAALEPESGVLHGAGQSPEEFARYLTVVEGVGRPLLSMMYISARDRSGRSLEKWRSQWEPNLSATPDLPLMPQIGLSMTRDGTPEDHYEHDVAEGLHDAHLLALFDLLVEWGRPFFLRIGYECNGPWNGYPPQSYRRAFRHVTRLLREHGAPGATVWCVEPHEIERVGEWYPGDDVVDWWSVDWFDPHHMDVSHAFLADARAHGKPVMIGESSPRHLGTRDPLERWDRWYRPYFETIRTSPGIKAFCYIERDWTRFPYWADWGDSRLDASPELTARWREEMRCPLYLHG